MSTCVTIDRFTDSVPICLRRDFSRVMMVTPTRAAYLGLLGQPSARRVGAISVYASVERAFRYRLGNGSWTTGDVATVPPNVSHWIQSDDRFISCFWIEPETTDIKALPGWMLNSGNTPELRQALGRLRQAYARLQSGALDPESPTQVIDQAFFGEVVPARHLDTRIAQVIRFISKRPYCATLEADSSSFATRVNLSVSRFLHLFTQETGMNFKRYRAWKRAREFLLHVQRDSCLTRIAQDIGYPDSSHFSHSIRRTFGLKPSDICAGSRRLRIMRGDNLQ